MKIAIYAGSFNPIHLGHLRLAECLIDKQLVEEVWFVVSPCNPLKNPDDQMDEYIRLDMVLAAISGKNQLKASDVEFTMPLPSYSIDTLHHLTKLYPQHQFALMIGSDNALVFDQWKNHQELLETFPVYVYPRKGYDFSTVAEIYPQMQLLDTPYYDISSTQIREMIHKGEDVAKWIHPAVLAYVRENGLYFE